MPPIKESAAHLSTCSREWCDTHATVSTSIECCPPEPQAQNSAAARLPGTYPLESHSDGPQIFDINHNIVRPVPGALSTPKSPTAPWPRPTADARPPVIYWQPAPNVTHHNTTRHNATHRNTTIQRPGINIQEVHPVPSNLSTPTFPNSSWPGANTAGLGPRSPFKAVRSSNSEMMKIDGSHCFVAEDRISAEKGVAYCNAITPPHSALTKRSDYHDDMLARTLKHGPMRLSGSKCFLSADTEADDIFAHCTTGEHVWSDAHTIVGSSTATSSSASASSHDMCKAPDSIAEHFKCGTWEIVLVGSTIGFVIVFLLTCFGIQMLYVQRKKKQSRRGKGKGVKSNLTARPSELKKKMETRPSELGVFLEDHMDEMQCRHNLTEQIREMV